MNCGPLSDVMVLGTPKWHIQNENRAAAQSKAEIDARGIASGQLVVLSITVNKWLIPDDFGIGSTRSTWIYEKRRPGIGICCTSVLAWRLIFHLWHTKPALVQLFTSLGRPHHTKRLQMRRPVAWILGCALRHVPFNQEDDVFYLHIPFPFLPLLPGY